MEGYLKGSGQVMETCTAKNMEDEQDSEFCAASQE